MTQTISLNLSTEAIMNEILAISALRCLSNSDESRPPILTRDRAPALKLLIKDAFAFVVMKIISYVEKCNLNDLSASPTDDDEILSVDLCVNNDVSSTITNAMRVTLNNCIAAYALHICYIGHDNTTSEQHLRIANAEIAALQQLLSTTSFHTVRISPSY